MAQALFLEGVSFGYRKERLVLNNISLQADPGEKIGIVGANGVGKSTFLRLLVGLEALQQGSVEIGGLQLQPKSLKEIRRKIGYVFQDSDSQMFLSTVKDNIAFGPSNYGVRGQELEEKVDRALAQVHGEFLKDRPIHHLSGGEKKLVSIATILSMEPEILMLDEPSVALDPRNRRNLIRLLNELPQTKLIASHDLDFILDTCDRALLFYQGEIAADGPTGEILSDEALLERCGLELPLSLSRR